LLDGGRRNDKHIEDLVRHGRQWKATPGPGAYRTPSCIGDPGAKSGRDRTDIPMGLAQHNKTPAWTMLTGRRTKTFHTLGDQPLVQHEGALRPPTPSAKKSARDARCMGPGIVPGPGHYFQRCSSAPSAFSDFHRPQGISLEAP
jgi:hypothetical protein